MNKLSLSLSFVQAELNASPIGETAICPYEAVYGISPKQYLMEPLPDQVTKNLQDYAKNQYIRILQLSRQIDAHYDKQANNLPAVTPKELYKVGDKVRIKKQQPKGANKLTHLPYSQEVYLIREVRVPTRSYLLELQRENRQPLIFLCHHRRCKKVYDRPINLQPDTGSIIQTQNTSLKPTKNSQKEAQSDLQEDQNNRNVEKEPVRMRTGRAVILPKKYQD